jgi:uncharacterized protein YkwD
MFPSDAARIAAAALVVGAFAGTSIAAASRSASGCPDATARVGQAPPAAIRAAVVCVLNDARADHGLPPMHANAALDRAAQHWTNTMVAGGSLSHGTDLGGRISAAGFRWATVGESIGSGYGTPNQIVNAWLASPIHCQIVLDPAYADIGAGVSRHSVAGYARGGATWTADFALPMGAHAPSGNWGPANRCPY